MNNREKYDYAQRDIYYVNRRIEELEKEYTIQKYKELLEERNILNEQLNNLYPLARKEEFDECNHVFVRDNDKVLTCLKCGLNSYANSEYYDYYENYQSLNNEGKLMHNYFNDNSRDLQSNYVIIDIKSDEEFYICKDIYIKMIRENKNIDNSLIKCYIDEALKIRRNDIKKSLRRY